MGGSAAVRTRLGLGAAALAAAVWACADAATGPGSITDSAAHLTVAEAHPAPAASGVDVRSPIVVTFSEALDSSTVADGLTLVRGADPVGGSVVQTAPATLRFEPTSPLDPGEDMEVRVAATLRGRNGAVPDAPLAWGFRTAGSPWPAADPDRLQALVSVLAADSLNGRGSGTPDEARAAWIIAGALEASGVKPWGDDWVLPFTATTQGQPPESVQSRNVLGVVPGVGDLVDEWVIVGAHYDHLGLGPGADGGLVVFNGADDNASGTAAVMELARLWAAHASASGAVGGRRSVLFAAWGAEERGLLGSCTFARSGDLPLDRVVAAFNFDMVGRLGDGPLRVPGMDSTSALRVVLSDANRAGLALDGTPVCERCSDHACFQDAGLPVLWFFTGGHADYHRPSDDTDRLDFAGLAAITEVALRALWRVAVG